MAVTFIVGMILGAMAQKMLDEDVALAQKNTQPPANSETKSETSGR